MAGSEEIRTVCDNIIENIQMGYVLMDKQQDLRFLARNMAEDHSFEIRVEARSGGRPHQKQIDLRDLALEQSIQYAENKDKFLAMYDEEMSAIAAEHISLDISREYSIASIWNLFALIIMLAAIGFVLYILKW